jgi:hypothetical protein
MTVSALQGQTKLLSLMALSKLSGTSATSKGTSTAASSGLGADATELSKPAELYAKLQQLQQSDPEKFKAVTADIAAKLKAAAADQGDGFGGKMLSDLAAKFEAVANGGDITQLKPPSGPPPGGGGGPQGPARFKNQDDELLLNLLNGLNGDQDTTQDSTQSGTSIKDLFASFVDEVTQALG